MFKRSSKLTAMLVAAAAVVSIVPASAAERLGTKEGTIDNARAYEGGYIYNGYRTDDDDQALYYNNGSKDVNSDEDEDYDNYSLGRYGEKYATIYDGDELYENEYLVDLSNGEINDDESVQDKIDNARNKLKTKINKEDRYKGFKDNGSEFEDFSPILEGKYGEVWYQYKALGDSDTSDRTTGAAAGYYLGFSNDSGKYIDISQTANMYIYLPKSQTGSDKAKTVKFDEYGDTNYKLTVKLDKVTPIAQDEDYIYTITKVRVTDEKDNEVDGVKSTQYFLQKISKEQGDKKDGAYLPKSVTSYQIDDNIVYKDTDMEEAFNVLMDKDGNVYNDSDYTAPDYLGDYRVKNVEVKNGTVYVTTAKKDSVKVFNLKLKKDKIKDQNDVKVDAYIVTKDDDADQDAIEISSDNAEAENWSIDIDGNTWVLDKGAIYKYDGSDFKEMYTVDRSLDQLDVYDENNLIAWCSDGDVYTTVSEGKAQTDEDGGVTEDTDTKVDTTVKAGWDKNTNGTWSFYKDGAKATGWVNDNGTWYYLDATGTMKTGWVQAGAWYYLNASGAMQTGWINDNGTWYYCNASGAMQTGWINDNGTWYYCNASGVMQTGWLLDGSTWYYLQSNGAMAANTTINGYVLGANGAWVR